MIASTFTGAKPALLLEPRECLEQAKRAHTRNSHEKKDVLPADEGY